MALFEKKGGSPSSKGTGFFSGKTLGQLEKEMIEDGTSPIKDNELTCIQFRFVQAQNGVEQMRALMEQKERIKAIANSPEEAKKLESDCSTMTNMLAKSFGIDIYAVSKRK